MRAAIAAVWTGSANTARVSGEDTKPGAIALQHTPCADHASAWARVSAATPAFDTPYAAGATPLPLVPIRKGVWRNRQDLWIGVS